MIDREKELVSDEQWLTLVREVVDNVVRRLVERELGKILGFSGYNDGKLSDGLSKLFIKQAEELAANDDEVRQAFRNKFLKQLKSNF